MRTGLMFKNVALVFPCISCFVACSVYDDRLIKGIDGGQKASVEGVTDQPGGGEVVNTKGGVADRERRWLLSERSQCEHGWRLRSGMW
jgi:hypothetical protein